MKLVVITGPTASGKTALGVLLAEKLGGEVINADSMQVYRQMDIGTAKPKPEEMRDVPHHMINVASPVENYSVSRYVQEASKCIEDVAARGRIPLIVGGTGLYIDSLIRGHDFAPQSGSLGLRALLSQEYDNIGGEAMLRRLREHDSEAAVRLHPNDKKRILRALEVQLTTGTSISEHDSETRRIPPRHEAVRIALNFRDRKDLYERIDRRVDTMIEAGLLREVRALLESGVEKSATAMQAIGYKELVAVLLGERSLEEAVSEVKRDSRRYAKRQLSWLGRHPETHWIYWEKETDFGAALLDSTKFLKISGIM